MILCDHQIEKEIHEGSLVSPYNPEQLGPASYDFLLGQSFLMIETGAWVPIDVQRETPMRRTFVGRDDPGAHLVLPPDGFVLGETYEYVRIPPYLAGRMEGKSSLGRLGLMVHSTAGFFDPGFEGIGTLEIHNVSGRPWLLRPGMRICQMAFFQMSREPLRPYGTDGVGKYQGQASVTGSKSHESE